MEGGLVTRSSFLAGRLLGGTARITHDGALAIVLAPVRVATWAKRCVVSSVRLLNPFNWRKNADRRPFRKSSPAGTPAPATRLSKDPRDGIPHPPARKASKTHAGTKGKETSSGRDVATSILDGVSKTLRDSFAERGSEPDRGVKEARRARPPRVRGRAAPPEVTRAEASAAVFAGAREKLVFSRALQDMARQGEAARARAARALGGIRHELSARALSAQLARDPSAEVRKECVNALAALGAKEELPAVEGALSDTSASVRLAAVRGTYTLAGPEGAASLVSMFSDEHEDVRRRAIACTGWLGQEHLAAELVPLLKDESAYVRRTTLDALGNLKSPDAVAEVIGLLNDPEEPVRKKAFDVLQTITGKQMVETFPDDEDGRQLLLARWRAWQQDASWRWEV